MSIKIQNNEKFKMVSILAGISTQEISPYFLSILSVKCELWSRVKKITRILLVKVGKR